MLGRARVSLIPEARPSDGSVPGLPVLRAVVARTMGSLAVAVVAPGMLISVSLLAFNIETAVVVALAWMA